MKTPWIIPALVLCASSQALAVRVIDEPKSVAGTATPASPTPNSAATAAQADDSSSLREGMITSVNAARDQIEVNGSWLKVESSKTRLFRQGRAVTSDALVKGQLVRFTLMPGDAQRSTLGVVYVP